MLPIGIIIGTLLTVRRGPQYALITAGLTTVAQALDAAYGPQVGHWLADLTRSLFL